MAVAVTQGLHPTRTSFQNDVMIVAHDERVQRSNIPVLQNSVPVLRNPTPVHLFADLRCRDVIEPAPTETFRVITPCGAFQVTKTEFY
jgi:hypothetical protein